MPLQALQLSVILSVLMYFIFLRYHSHQSYFLANDLQKNKLKTVKKCSFDYCGNISDY